MGTVTKIVDAVKAASRKRSTAPKKPKAKKAVAGVGPFKAAKPGKPFDKSRGR